MRLLRVLVMLQLRSQAWHDVWQTPHDRYTCPDSSFLDSVLSLAEDSATRALSERTGYMADAAVGYQDRVWPVDATAQAPTGDREPGLGPQVRLVDLQTVDHRSAIDHTRRQSGGCGVAMRGALRGNPPGRAPGLS